MLDFRSLSTAPYWIERNAFSACSKPPTEKREPFFLFAIDLRSDYKLTGKNRYSAISCSGIHFHSACHALSHNGLRCAFFFACLFLPLYPYLVCYKYDLFFSPCSFWDQTSSIIVMREGLRGYFSLACSYLSCSTQKQHTDEITNLERVRKKVNSFVVACGF